MPGRVAILSLNSQNSWMDSEPELNQTQDSHQTDAAGDTIDLVEAGGINVAKSVVAFRPSDSKFVVMLAVLVGIFLCVHIAKLNGWGLKPIAVQHVVDEIQYKIDINRSSWVEWAQLPNIGEATARRIVADRTNNGPFSSVDDVQRVSGIGPATLDRLRPWLAFGGNPKLADVAH